MRFEDSGIENLTIEESDLKKVMDEKGFVLGSKWDYERMTFDRKIEIKDDVFYLRVQGVAIDGEIGGRYAVVKLITPILGQFHFPHTMEYGEAEDFPKSLIEHCKDLLSQVKVAIEKFQITE